MEKQKKTRKNEGITLVALVVTIIILLILAGITISQLNDNGLLKNAQYATDETRKKEIEEQIQLAILSSYGTDGKISKDLLKENLNRIKGIEKIEEVVYPLTAKVNGYEFQIFENGNVIYRGEIKLADLTENENIDQSSRKTVDTSDATAIASDILKDKTAYVNGEKVIGTMEDRGYLNWNPSESISRTIEPGYYSGGTISTSNAYSTAQEENVVVAPVLLWSNPSPSASFAAQTITLDLSSYSRVIIGWKYRSSNTKINVYNINNVNNTRTLQFVAGYPSGGIILASRYLTVNSTGIEFEQGINYTDLTGSNTNDNSKAIPIKIYGIPDGVLE